LSVTQSTEAIAKILNIRLLGFIYEYIARICLGRVVAHLRHKARLRHIEMAAALRDFLPGLIRCKRRPLGHDIEVARNL